MKSSKMLAAVLLAGFIGIVQTTGAFASTSVEVCVSRTYFCVTPYSAYRGEDPYDVDHFNTKTSPYNGTKHSCTSFVAYMLAYHNPWMPPIAYFDSAYAWDTQAVNRVGARLVTIPKVGDIAQWEITSIPDYGHVGYITAVSLNIDGSIKSLEVIDDNGGRFETTRKILYPESVNGVDWPDHFIHFLDYSEMSSGGGVIDRVPLSISLDGF